VDPFLGDTLALVRRLDLHLFGKNDPLGQSSLVDSLFFAFSHRHEISQKSMLFQSYFFLCFSHPPFASDPTVPWLRIRIMLPLYFLQGARVKGASGG
jgi:hypothetical protein